MNKVLPVTVLLGFAVIFVWSYSAFDMQTVFAQTPDDPNAGPVPEGNYTDPNLGPVPEDNSSDTGSIPDDNSTSTVPDDSSLGVPTNDPLANNTLAEENATAQHVSSTQIITLTPDNKTSTLNLSPLEQVKSGVDPKSVQCKQGFTLINKIDDDSAACVEPQVAQILIQRGW